MTGREGYVGEYQTTMAYIEDLNQTELTGYRGFQIFILVLIFLRIYSVASEVVRCTLYELVEFVGSLSV